MASSLTFGQKQQGEEAEMGGLEHVFRRRAIALRCGAYSRLEYQHVPSFLLDIRFGVHDRSSRA